MAAQLPKFQTELDDLSLLQTAWTSILNPIVTNPANNSIILKSVALINGTTTINHKLGRKLTGWVPIRWHGAFAQVYDLQDTNSQPGQTLVLVANGAVTVDLLIF